MKARGAKVWADSWRVGISLWWAYIYVQAGTYRVGNKFVQTPSGWAYVQADSYRLGICSGRHLAARQMFRQTLTDWAYVQADTWRLGKCLGRLLPTGHMFRQTLGG
jgi:hypothetical protein